MSTLTFDSLPLEIHLEICSYLLPLDRTRLSHVSQTLQTLYRSNIWKFATLVENNSSPSGCMFTRLIPLNAFLAPEKYSWVCNDSIETLILGSGIIEDYVSLKRLLSSSLRRSDYKRLRNIEIVNGVSFQRCFHDFVTSQFAASIMAPHTCDNEGETGPGISLPPLKLALGIDFLNLFYIPESPNFFSTVAKLELKMSAELDVGLPSTASFDSLCDIRLIGINRTLFTDILSKLVDCTHLYSFFATLEVWHPEVATELYDQFLSISKLPWKCLENCHVQLLATNDFSDPGAELSNTNEDIVSSLELLDIPQVKMLTIPAHFDFGVLNKILTFPGLDALQAPIKQNWQKLIPATEKSIIDQNKLTFLEISLSDMSHSPENIANIVTLVDGTLGQLKSLKRLVVTGIAMNRSEAYSSLINLFLRRVQEEYAQKGGRGDTPSVETLELIVSDLLKQHGGDYETKKDVTNLLVSLVYDPLSTFTNPDQESKINLLYNRQPTSPPSVTTTAPFLNEFLTISILEAIFRCVYSIPTLEHIALNSHLGFHLSPALQRMVRFHPNLKQVLMLSDARQYFLPKGSLYDFILDTPFKLLYLYTRDATTNDIAPSSASRTPVYQTANSFIPHVHSRFQHSFPQLTRRSISNFKYHLSPRSKMLTSNDGAKIEMFYGILFDVKRQREFSASFVNTELGEAIFKPEHGSPQADMNLNFAEVYQSGFRGWI